MSRLPSEATQLRSAKQKINQLDAALGTANGLVREFRARATKAEQEAAEWKQRFDLLLRRTPEAGEQS